LSKIPEIPNFIKIIRGSLVVSFGQTERQTDRDNEV